MMGGIEGRRARLLRGKTFILFEGLPSARKKKKIVTQYLCKEGLVTFSFFFFFFWTEKHRLHVEKRRNQDPDSL